jgi:hypothetical protein
MREILDRLNEITIYTKLDFKNIYYLIYLYLSLHPEVEALFAERRASPPGLAPVFVYKTRISRYFNYLQIFYFRRLFFFYIDFSFSFLFISDNYNAFLIFDLIFFIISKLFRLYYRFLFTVSTLYNFIMFSACNSSFLFFVIYWAIIYIFYFYLSASTILRFRSIGDFYFIFLALRQLF